MLRTKDTLPQVYSESYDFQIFTSLLDAIKARRAIEIERIRVAHSPRECFIEDLPHLASNFDLPSDSSRELLANYLSITKYKGTQTALQAMLDLTGVTNYSILINDKEEKNEAGEIVKSIRVTQVEIKGDFINTNWSLFHLLRERWLPINIRFIVSPK